MIVRILTDRPDQYAFLENLYRSRAEILYTAGSEWMTADSMAEADIVIVDPVLTEGKQFTGTMMKRRTAQGRAFLISDPTRARGLVRELKAAGLEADRDLPEGEAGMELTEFVLPGTGNPQVQQPSFRCVIGILALNEGAGAGFLTMMLAEEMASESFRDGSLVTVFAPDTDYFFNALGLGKKYGQEGFKELSEVLQEAGLEEGDGRIVVNASEGISWAVGSGGDGSKEEWSEDQKTELARRIAGNYFLYFCGAHPSVTEWKEMQSMLNVLVVASDPLPSSLLAGKQMLETVKQLGLPLIFVINHVTEAVKKDLILDYLDGGEVVFVPAVDQAAICEAEYLEENPYRIDRVRKQAMAPMCGIIEQIRKLGNLV